jgi:hypothetical protein
MRKNLLNEGKTTRYFKYAIGEIILVVIGILIALQINTWNDYRKKNNLKASYVASLKKDLAADIVYFETQIEMDSIDFAKMMSLSARLSNSLTTKDTLVKIARYEFLPFTDVNNELNMSTYNSLITTGNIDVFDAYTSESLLKFNNLQLNSNSIMDRNDELYFNSVVVYRNKYPFNSARNGINGPFMDSFWETLDENELKSDFNGILTAKLSMLSSSILDRKGLLLKTEEMLITLNGNHD